jgi:regulator of nucleoside diphosphate kinase
MSFTSPVEPTLTLRDHARLNRLPMPLPEPLRQLLDNAVLLPSDQVPPAVVTMNTRLLANFEQSGAEQAITLCYPDDAEAEAGLVSVLSPVGSALLGRHSGEQVSWRTPMGEVRRLRIAGVLFQPEAAGDFLL